MKRIGLIAFALLVVALAAAVVLIATLPTARVTISAIGPTGKTATITNDARQIWRLQEWQFGFTNVGRAEAVLDPFLLVRLEGLPGGHDWMPRDASPRRVWKPGEGTVKSMLVPADDKTPWRGVVYCKTLPTPFQDRIWKVVRKRPILARLLPRPFEARYPEPIWHTTTNATATSSTATNTP